VGFGKVWAGGCPYFAKTFADIGLAQTCAMRPLSVNDDVVASLFPRIATSAGSKK
jgi:hypothetical protein